MPDVPKLLEWALTVNTVDNPFYSVMCSLFPTFAMDLKDPNIMGCTNGEHIIINSASPHVNKENIRAILAHEVDHIIFHHTRYRTAPLSPAVYRLAQELEADMHIPDSFGSTGANDPLYDWAKRLLGEKIDTLEKIYLHLLDNTSICSSCAGRFVEGDKDQPIGGSAPADEREGAGGQVDPGTVSGKVLAAEQMSRGMGSMPSNLQQFIAGLRSPRVDWRAQLRQYWGTKVGLWDVETQRISPVYYAALGMHLPPLMPTHGLPDVVWAIDTSGSMTGKPLEVGLSEIRGLSGISSEVDVYVCDAEVHAVMRLQDVTDEEVLHLSRNMSGGGGTDFRPVFEALKSRENTPQLLVYMTDTWGSFPDEPPPYPVLWLIPQHEDAEVPFGDKIHIPTEECV